MYISDAELITLVGHGNSFLSGSENYNALISWSSDVWMSPVMFQWNEALEITCDTADWFRTLRLNGANRLWYVTVAWNQQDLPERHVVLSRGTGAQAIQVDYPQGYELWHRASATGILDKSGRTIWIKAHKSYLSQYPEAFVLGIEATRPYLQQKLETAAEFAQRAKQEADHWAPQFRAAVEMLTTAVLPDSFRTNLLPEDGYALSARQLLVAAASSNIFGGMMSWNDLAFDDKPLQAEYEKVRHELSDAVYTSFIAAVNAFDEKLVIQKR